MALYGSIGAPPGDRLVYGTVALDGSNPTDVVIPKLDPGERIKAAQVTQNVSSAPGDSTEEVTCTFSGMTLSLYGWMNTGGTDPTLVASTGTQSIHYLVVVGR